MAVLDDETARFIQEMSSSPPVDPDSIPMETFRAGMKRFEAVDFDYVDLASVLTLEPNDERPVRMRVYQPTDADALPVLVWAHGGSWVRGSLDSHDRMLRLIAHIANAAVVSVDYRLAPEHRYPAPLTDVHRSLQWVAINGDRHGWDTTRLAIGGDSSGASLAAGAAWLHRGSAPALSALILLVPVLDL